ncbi:hypothetical protein [Labedella endophytica]|uniref:arsenate reductase/protein-tyrosine-phosphatase family protein n=1 Tax=Labedella endophytica TaxID=1523160 RepID=UPI00140A0D97|nr:hypothetical protein [Labedella endophytica]
MCAANVCRSPLAEYLLARGLASLPEFEGHSVSSAGAGARDGAGLCERVDERIGADGAEFAAAHRSSRLTAADVGRSALVLTASKAERAAVATIDPSARSRTFTLREAMYLAAAEPIDSRAGADEEPLTVFAAEIHGRRGLMRSTPAPAPSGLRTLLRRKPTGDPLDVPDGHHLTLRQHRSALDDVSDAVDSILGALRRLTR